MDKRLKELAEQAGLDAKEIREDGLLTLYAFENFELELFAKLVRDDEREAIAKMFEAKIWAYEKREIVAAIRARGEK